MSIRPAFGGEPSAGMRHEIALAGHELRQRAGEERLRNPTDQIIFDVVEALMAGIPEEEVSRLSIIDPWFVAKLKNIVDMHRQISKAGREGIEKGPL